MEVRDALADPIVEGDECALGADRAADGAGERAGVREERLERDQLPKAPAITRPLAIGIATARQ